MIFAVAMIFLASLAPYVAVTLARRQAEAIYDNNTPRLAIEKLGGWRQRLEWAHRNNFEAFPPFAAAMILAMMQHVPWIWVDSLGAVFVAARIVHNLMYALDRPTLRSFFWTVGYAAVLALMLFAAAA